MVKFHRTYRGRQQEMTDAHNEKLREERELRELIRKEKGMGFWEFLDRNITEILMAIVILGFLVIAGIAVGSYG